jgi:hypothetical protein
MSRKRKQQANRDSAGSKDERTSRLKHKYVKTNKANKDTSDPSSLRKSIFKKVGEATLKLSGGAPQPIDVLKNVKKQDKALNKTDSPPLNPNTLILEGGKVI